MSANLYIKRETNVSGSGVKYHVILDNKKVGEIGNGKVKRFSIRPGAHRIHTKLWTGKSSEILNFDVKDDEVLKLTCGLDNTNKMFLKRQDFDLSLTKDQPVSNIGVFGFLISIIGLLWGLYYVVGASSINLTTITKPSTNAVVTRSWISYARLIKNGVDAGDTCFPIIDYQFDVNGEVYTGAQTLKTDEVGRSCNEQVSKYTTGDSIYVYYDPNNPNTSWAKIPYAISPLPFAIFAIGVILSLPSFFRVTRSSPK